MTSTSDRVSILGTYSAWPAPKRSACPTPASTIGSVPSVRRDCPTPTTRSKPCSTRPKSTRRACSVVWVPLPSSSVPGELSRSGRIRRHKRCERRCEDVLSPQVWSVDVDTSSYQQHVTKNLTERYSHLSQSMDKVIHDANSEIQRLQNKIQGRHVFLAEVSS